MTDLVLPPPPPTGSLNNTILSGNSVRVTSLTDGEAKILVTALGSGNEQIQQTITVTVEGVATRFAELYDLVEAADPNKSFVITAEGFERLPPQMLDFNKPVTITLKGTPDVELALDGYGSMFTVGNGVKLILEDITLRGLEVNNSSIIKVEEGGSLVLKAGSKIADNINYAETYQSYGGGVRVYESGTLILDGGEISGNLSYVGGGVFNEGAFTMDSGKISDNGAEDGGGVFLSIGTFTMNDGEISDNVSTYEGGGVFVSRTTFEMKGGSIINNQSDMGGGVSVYGLLNEEGIFNMKGGIISGNEAICYSWYSEGGGGVNVSANSTFNMDGGEISENTSSGTQYAQGGGGVRVEGIFNLNDGEISGNTSASRGGGVNIAVGTADAPGTLNMNGGAISGNLANGDNASTGGGGLWIRGVFNLFNGEVSDNKAVRGAGLFTVGIFNMHGGVISGNSGVANKTTNGGGVYIYATNNALDVFGTFNMYDGVISGNTCSSAGGGVYHAGYFGILRVENGIIYGNDAADEELKNTAGSYGGASLDVWNAVTTNGLAQYGTFDNAGNWVSSGDFGTTTNFYSINTTIEVENGVLK